MICTCIYCYTGFSSQHEIVTHIRVCSSVSVAVKTVSKPLNTVSFDRVLSVQKINPTHSA